MEQDQTSTEIGPLAWANWRSFLSGTPAGSAIEIPIYSHGTMSMRGEIKAMGPHALLNTIPMVHRLSPRECIPVLVLRVFGHVDTMKLAHDPKLTQVGGGLGDEIASLLSLLTGARLRAGGVTREFVHGGDEFGDPRVEDPLQKPMVTMRRDGEMLPGRSTIDCNVENSRKLLESYPELPAPAAAALARSSGLYASAIWIADEDPQQAWIWLVSSIEAAANYNFDKVDIDPLELLREAMPGVATELTKRCDEHGARAIAKKLKGLSGATYKFLSMIQRFMPSAPDARPLEWMRVDWGAESMRDALKTVYAHRSYALHAGHPVPRPMCVPPFVFQQGHAPAEAPLHMVGWEPHEAPMCLHVFEYIVRAVLFAWWQDMVTMLRDPARA